MSLTLGGSSERAVVLDLLQREETKKERSDQDDCTKDLESSSRFDCSTHTRWEGPHQYPVGKGKLGAQTLVYTLTYSQTHMHTDTDTHAPAHAFLSWTQCP